MQYFSQYEYSMCIAEGISVASLRSILYSLVFYKYKYDSGMVYPRCIDFHWIVSHPDILTCRFMCRAFSEVTDELSELRAKNGSAMANRAVNIHVWVVDIPQPLKVPDINHLRVEENDQYGPNHYR